ncbi:MAG: hypothetical protein HYY18_23355 [Planctomycetes bacterium]|nr:hypothetical protein [Planctomycetota bacterium]
MGCLPARTVARALVLAGFLGTALFAEEAAAPGPEDIRQWILDLGAEDPAIRDRAQARLMEVGPERKDLLAEGAKNPDAEIAARVTTVLNDGLIGCLESVRADALLEVYWTRQSVTIARWFEGRYPVLQSDPALPVPVEMSLPGEEAWLGDWGRVEWSQSESEVGKDARKIAGGGRGVTPRDGELMFKVENADSHFYRLVDCDATAVATLRLCDGRKSLKEIASESDAREVLRAMLVLQKYGVLRFSGTVIEAGSGLPLIERLKEARAAGLPKDRPMFVRRIYSCGVGE